MNNADFAMNEWRIKQMNSLRELEQTLTNLDRHIGILKKASLEEIDLDEKVKILRAKKEFQKARANLRANYFLFEECTQRLEGLSHD